MDRRWSFAIVGFFLLVTYFLVMLPSSYRFPWLTAAFMVVMALPAFVAAVLDRGWVGLAAVVALGAFSLFIEGYGLLTGFPYGPFAYGDGFGTKVFGVVPLLVFFAWPPLVFGAWSWLRERVPRYAVWLAPFLLVLVDVVLDPVNAALGFWVWPLGGFFYGVPLSNFFGWVFSGFLGVLIVAAFFPQGLRSAACYSLFLVVVFAACASLWLGLWMPFVVGAVLLVLSYRSLPADLADGFRN